MRSKLFNQLLCQLHYIEMNNASVLLIVFALAVSSQCLTCPLNYYLNNDLGTCLLCSVGCLTCCD